MDELIEKLRSVKWEVTSDGDRMPDDSTHECVFVDMRPADFSALLTEAAAALEAAREDAERYRWLRENCVDWAEDTDEPQLVHRDGGLWRTDWRERLDTAIDRARRPYNASGSLSEYGILPECDAAIDRAREERDALAHGDEE